MIRTVATTVLFVVFAGSWIVRGALAGDMDTVAIGALVLWMLRVELQLGNGLRPRRPPPS